jgi:hypothetical protein
VVAAALPATLAAATECALDNRTWLQRGGSDLNDNGVSNGYATALNASILGCSQ